MRELDSKYEDIIHMPYHVSSTRPRMSMIDRAAQFSAFQALSGYSAAVKETARLTDEKIELTEEEKVILNEKLQQILTATGSDLSATFTYFKPDPRKAGGKYENISGTVKRIDEFERCVILIDGHKIPIDDIYEINIEYLVLTI